MFGQSEDFNKRDVGCLARPAWERNKLSRLECWSLVGGGALRYLKEFCLDRHLSTSLKYIVIKFFLKEPIDEPSLYVFLKFFFKKVSVWNERKGDLKWAQQHCYQVDSDIQTLMTFPIFLTKSGESVCLWHARLAFRLFPRHSDHDTELWVISKHKHIFFAFRITLFHF